MDKRILLFLSVVFLALKLNAVCVLTAKCSGGDWTAASTWTAVGCAGVTTPASGCIIIIPLCATVNVDINSPSYNNMEIYVSGTLTFDVGQKINMCPGYLKVFPGGQLTGGNPGSKIDICGTTVWNGGSTTAGPIEFGGGTTLPIELLGFSAAICGNAICTEWKTASELNNDFFTLQRSTDAQQFENIATIDGAGNSTALLNYSFIDEAPLPGTSYYRLMQTDFNGDYSYSDIDAVSLANDDFDFMIYPSPGSRNELRFKSLGVESDGILSISITDVDGRELFKMKTGNGPREFLLSPGGDLQPGVYTAVVERSGRRYYRKLVVN